MCATISLRWPTETPPRSTFSTAARSMHLATFSTLTLALQKSILVNLKAEDDRKAFLQLIAKSDVILESFRPGRNSTPV